MLKFAVPLGLPLALVFSLSACGQAADLQPRPGKALPVSPLGRDERFGKSAGELLAPKVQDAPGRSDELRSRSEERQDDPFDLPPQG